LHPSHPHILTLHCTSDPSLPFSSGFSCNVCRSSNNFRWHCYDCSFDICEVCIGSCIQLDTEKYIGLLGILKCIKNHPLIWETNLVEGSVCDFCRTEISSAYACKNCEFYCCSTCASEEKKLRRLKEELKNIKKKLVGIDSKNLEFKNCKLKLQEKIKNIKKNIFQKNTKKEKESLGGIKTIRDVYKKLKYSKRKLNNYQDKFFSQQIKVTKLKKELNDLKIGCHKLNVVTENIIKKKSTITAKITPSI
jgi:hypothetical protein